MSTPELQSASILEKFNDIERTTKERTGIMVGGVGYDPDTQEWIVQKPSSFYNPLASNFSAADSILFKFHWYSDCPCGRIWHPEVYDEFLAALNKAIDEYLEAHPRAIAL